VNLIERLNLDERYARRAMFLVLLFGIAIRLPGLTSPIADRQSWNQCSTATVIRNFAENGFDLLHPEWDVLDPGGTGPNIEAEEAPIYSGASAILYTIFGQSHAWPRLLSILAMIVGGLYLFRLAARIYDPSVGLFALFIWNLAPYPWFFGRTIMSDPWMLAASIAAADYYELWLRDDRTSHLLKSGIATALAGLFKAFALHIGFLFLMAGLLKKRAKLFSDWRIYIFGAICLIPPIAWIYYASLIGSLGNVTEAPGEIIGAPHLWGSWSMLIDLDFWNRIQSRIFDRSMTPVATIFVALSILFSGTRRKSGYIWLWLLAALGYVLMVKSGNNEHNYYQLPFTPPLAILAGAGLSALAGRVSQSRRSAVVIAALTIFTLVSFLYVRGEYRQDLSSVEAGKLARAFSEPGDIILVLDPGSTRKNQVLYHAYRRGWHVGRLDGKGVEKYISWGATHAVICLSDDQRVRGHKAIRYLDRHYRPLGGAAVMGDGRLHKIRIYELKAKDIETP